MDLEPVVDLVGPSEVSEFTEFLAFSEAVVDFSESLFADCYYFSTKDDAPFDADPIALERV